MSRLCRSCGGVLGRDCFNEMECMSISASYMQSEETKDFCTALDFIKELCDVLEKHPTDQQTVSNTYCNAMTFYEQFRPRTATPEYNYSDGTFVDDLPF
jgi:F0F1-type ATP synthase gamma subunit